LGPASHEDVARPKSGEERRKRMIRDQWKTPKGVVSQRGYMCKKTHNRNRIAKIEAGCSKEKNRFPN